MNQNGKIVNIRSFVQILHLREHYCETVWTKRPYCHHNVVCKNKIYICVGNFWIQQYWAGDKGWGHCMVDPHVDGGWDRIVPHDLLLTKLTSGSGHMETPLWTEWQTDTTENITFLQPRLWAVITGYDNQSMSFPVQYGLPSCFTRLARP